MVRLAMVRVALICWAFTDRVAGSILIFSEDFAFLPAIELVAGMSLHHIACLAEHW